MRKTTVLFGIFCICLASAAWSASVSVPGDSPTVQGALTLAGVGGTVTITDSAVYTEDVFIIPGLHDGVTIQAAPGQTPTIRAANTTQRWTHLPFPPGANDYMGLIASTDCTLIGLRIENIDPTLNLLGVAGVMVIQAVDAPPSPPVPRVTLQNCQIVGPGVDPGDFAGCPILSWSYTNYPEAVFEDCEFSETSFGLVPINFAPALGAPSMMDPVTTATNCWLHDHFGDAIDHIAGVGTYVNCLISSNSETGINVEGDVAYFIGCDIVDNGAEGVQLDYDDSFQDPPPAPLAIPAVSMTDCLIARNKGGGEESNIRINHGTLAIARSIISEPENTMAIFMNDNFESGFLTPCNLVMDFCDVHGGLQNCFGFGTDVKELDIYTTVTNSILVGADGLVNPDSSYISAYLGNCAVWASGIATSATTVNVITTDEPIYMLPYSATRDGFRYYNDDFNIGTGGQYIGSQGYFEPGELRARNWSLYN